MFPPKVSVLKWDTVDMHTMSEREVFTIVYQDLREQCSW
jgi:hypothetical protein